MNNTEPQPEPFPFDEFCGCCGFFNISDCPFCGQTDALTRWKSLGCSMYKPSR